LDLPLLLMLLLVLLVVGKPAHVAAAVPSLKIKARHQVIMNLLLLLEVWLLLGVRLGNSRVLMSRPCRRVTLVDMRKFASINIAYPHILKSIADPSLVGEVMVVLNPGSRRRSLMLLKNVLLLLLATLLPALRVRTLFVGV
jgi:hypothetical protein